MGKVGLNWFGLQSVGLSQFSVVQVIGHNIGHSDNEISEIKIRTF